MKRRKGLGFHWFCGRCISNVDGAMKSDRIVNQMDEKLSNICCCSGENPDSLYDHSPRHYQHY